MVYMGNFDVKSPCVLYLSFVCDETLPLTKHKKSLTFLQIQITKM